MVAQAETLPIPDDFRFQWDSPEEAAHFWMLDMMHWPHGLSPLSATMDIPAFMRGFTKAARELCMPFTSMHSKVIHGWVYMNAEPYSADPVQLERRMADMQAQMGKHVPGLLERWRDVYEPKGSEHLQLLQGFPNKSIEVGVGLWNLAREAQKRPEVLATLRRVPPSDADSALDQCLGGPPFRGAVREFLSDYGWRANESDLAVPTWFEQPAPAYALIREYASRHDYDPEAEFNSLVSARQAREEVLFKQLAGGPIDMFQQVLAGAQQYLPIQEDHNFWIDQVGLSVQRVPALEAGRRLTAAGRLAAPEDVFFLHYDELQDALRGGKGDLKELVQRRRSERAEGHALTPPPALGTPPPAELGEDPMLWKFFGAPPEEHPNPHIINGNAASAGC